MRGVVFEDPFVAAMVAAFLVVLVWLSVIDVRERRIPNVIVVPALLLFAAAIAGLRLAGRPVEIASALIGFGAFGGALLVLALIRPGALGMGDAKLAALIGLVLGSLGLRYVVVGAVLGLIAGGIGGVVALAAGRPRTSGMPYGPFLAAGAAAAALFAPAIADGYLSLYGR